MSNKKPSPVSADLVTSSNAPNRWSDRLSQTWLLALMGAVLYWISLPPIKAPLAGFLASVCWVAIVAKESAPTRREYWSIWLVSALMWLALLQGIRLAFWPLYLGWIALSLYIAVYLPLFVSFARSLHRELHFPLPLAASTAWVGCELIRAYFATGFAACMLAHSQTPWPWMLPVASHFGSYGVSFIVMFVGAVLFQWINWGFGCPAFRTSAKSKRFVFENLTYSLLSVAVLLGSLWSLQRHDQWLASQEPIKPLGSVLLIQENMPTQFDAKQDDIILGWQRYEQQMGLAARTSVSQGVDLVLWPESTFSGGVPWIDWDLELIPPAELDCSQAEFEKWLSSLESMMEGKLNRIYAPFQPRLPKFILGTDALKLRSGKLSTYNAALWVDPENRNACEYYAKHHLVMFGEYIPILSYFPNLLRSLGLPRVDAGDKPMAWRLPSGATVSISICFEDVLPHLIQSQVRQLTAIGKSPDMLVNITNDGWFRGSSILDHHLNNAILAAVENRRPMLVAANSGISAWIDGDGRIVRSLPRMEVGSILAEPIPDARWGWWQSVGDWPARSLAIVCFVPLLRWRRRSTPDVPGLGIR